MVKARDDLAALLAEAYARGAIAPRPGQDGTWISADMVAAYIALHELEHAHSVEVFDGERLVGRIYGVAIGQLVLGARMFSARSGGSERTPAGW